jgi:hypothetical protein
MRRPKNITYSSLMMLIDAARGSKLEKFTFNDNILDSVMAVLVYVIV